MPCFKHASPNPEAGGRPQFSARRSRHVRAAFARRSRVSVSVDPAVTFMPGN